MEKPKRVFLTNQSLPPLTATQPLVNQELPSKRRKAEQPKRLPYIPPEIIQVILSKLSKSNLYDFRFVSQSTTSLIKEHHLAKIHYLNTHHQPRVDSLLLRTPTDLYAIQNLEKLYRIVKLKNVAFRSWISIFRVMASCNGVICVADETCNYRSIVFSNPVTGEWQLAPDVPVFGLIDGKFFCFGYDPRVQKHRVIRWRKVNKTKIIMESHIIGTDSWKSYELEGHRRITGPMGRPYGVLIQGYMHCLSIGRGSAVDSIAVYAPVGVSETVLDIRHFALPEPLVGYPYTRFIMLELEGKLTVGYDSPAAKAVNLWQMKCWGFESWEVKYVIPRPSCCWRPCKHTSMLEPLGMMRNGNIIVDYTSIHGKGLFSYDLQRGKTAEFEHEGLPVKYEATPHTATFLPLSKVFTMEETYLRSTKATFPTGRRLQK